MCFVNHNGRDTMNEDVGAYRPFLSESVPLSFSKSSPTTLAVVSDRLRDDLPKTAFQTAACLLKNAERRVISINERKGRIRTPNLTHTQLFSQFRLIVLAWSMLIPPVIIRSARISFRFLICRLGQSSS